MLQKSYIGPYRIQSELGRGATFIVWRGWDPKLEREVAIKELLYDEHLAPKESEELGNRFVREGISSSDLNNPDSVTIYTAGMYEGRPALIMEYTEGMTLADFLGEEEYATVADRTASKERSLYSSEALVNDPSEYFTDAPQNDSTSSFIDGDSQTTSSAKNGKRVFLAAVGGIGVVALIVVYLFATSGAGGGGYGGQTSAAVSSSSMSSNDSNEVVPSEDSTSNPGFFSDVRVGESIIFGTYGGREIEWRVLDVEEEGILLLSKDILALNTYNESYEPITWEYCTLRSWLNSTFLSSAFTHEESTYIQDTTLANADNPQFGTPGGNNTSDRVFLLSIDEVQEYLPTPSSRIAQICLTQDTIDMAAKEVDQSLAFGGNLSFAEAKEQIATWNNKDFLWTLRSPGSDASNSANVESNGTLLLSGGSGFIGIRPAIWVSAYRE